LLRAQALKKPVHPVEPVHNSLYSQPPGEHEVKIKAALNPSD
jgi:hypothetical protein